MARVNFEELMEQHAIVNGKLVRKSIAEQLKKLNERSKTKQKTRVTLEELRNMQKKR